MTKQVLVVLILLMSNCCTYLFQTEYKGLVISGGPKSAAIEKQYEIKLTYEGKEINQDSRDTTMYQIGTVFSHYEV